MGEGEPHGPREREEEGGERRKRGGGEHIRPYLFLTQVFPRDCSLEHGMGSECPCLKLEVFSHSGFALFWFKNSIKNNIRWSLLLQVEVEPGRMYLGCRLNPRPRSGYVQKATHWCASPIEVSACLSQEGNPMAGSGSPISDHGWTSESGHSFVHRPRSTRSCRKH